MSDAVTTANKLVNVDAASQYCLTRLRVLTEDETALVKEINERAQQLNAVRSEKAALLGLFQVKTAPAPATQPPAEVATPATPPATPSPVEVAPPVPAPPVETSQPASPSVNPTA